MILYRHNFLINFSFILRQEEAETALERLIGLSEMFPEPVRNAVGKSADLAGRSVKSELEISDK